MKGLKKIAWVLVIIGGLNWLLVGLFGEDIVSMLGFGSTVGKAIYILVGLSAIIALFGKGKSSQPAPMM